MGAGRARPAARRNPLSALSRWKILDNLRRSLVPAALLVLLVAGLAAAVAACSRGPLAVLAMMLLPALLSALLELVRKPREVQLGQHLRAGCQAGVQHFARMALALACLPYEALYQPRRDRAHAVADGGQPAPPAGVAALERGRAAQRQRTGRAVRG